MDISLIKTFLEVVASGSFVSASERLLVTQSAVSLRIQRLEDSLGKPLFTRSKAGAELTPAGGEFEPYALSLLRIWEEARQQIAIPEGFTRSIHIGAQYSLWPRLGFQLIDALRTAAPDLSVRGELGMSDRLTRMLIEGSIQFGLFYTPQLRPGLVAEEVMEEELILVATWPDADLNHLPGYIFVDWGPEFVHAHALELPGLTNPGLTLALGALAAEFVVRREGAAYLPARYVKRYLDANQLHLVAGAPAFPYPIWAVWREDLEADVIDVTKKALRQVALSLDAEQEELVSGLREIALGHVGQGFARGSSTKDKKNS
ncbi:MAG: LysR family transcriptional regulator [Defluviimonas sp.]|nr:LysR family transcriptional regulator [Paracoccaceae bacterium]MCC0062829.1 LysR family transcriptional regulator [Defluviimonas sp.]